MDYGFRNHESDYGPTGREQETVCLVIMDSVSSLVRCIPCKSRSNVLPHVLDSLTLSQHGERHPKLLNETTLKNSFTSATLNPGAKSTRLFSYEYKIFQIHHSPRFALAKLVSVRKKQPERKDESTTHKISDTPTFVFLMGVNLTLDLNPTTVHFEFF